jgi:putative intracellular protease/amidase
MAADALSTIKTAREIRRTAATQDADTLAFLADRGKTARSVTSVCTGAVILGAAGLLDGYRPRRTGQPMTRSRPSAWTVFTAGSSSTVETARTVTLRHRIAV